MSSFKKLLFVLLLFWNGNLTFSLHLVIENGEICNNYKEVWGPGGGTLGISGWGCAAGTLEPLAYTRASSAELCDPILE